MASIRRRKYLLHHAGNGQAIFRFDPVWAGTWTSIIGAGANGTAPHADDHAMAEGHARPMTRRATTYR
jgi:hypothetical protein